MKKEKTKKVKSNTKKKTTKEMRIIPIVTISLAMILVALIGFFGVYVQTQNRMENKVKDYQYSMDLTGVRTIVLNPTESTKTVIKDQEGNEVADASDLTDEELTAKGYTEEEVPYNGDDVLTKENYKKTKQIIEKRFKELNIQNYKIRLNEENGQITIEIPENEETDNVVSNLATTGKFTIADNDTQEILMASQDIKRVQVMSGYASSTSNAVSVYLDIEFTKEGAKKFEKITETYTGEVAEEREETTTEENVETEETELTNEIIMKIDDQEMLTTSFDEVVKTGKMQLTLGSSTTDQETLNDNIKSAQNIAVVLNNGEMPVKYDINKNEYILSEVTNQDIQNIAYAIAIISAIGILVWIVRYHLKGLVAGVSFVGFAGLYLLLIRYTNVVLSLEGITGIAIVLVLNYMLMNRLIEKIVKSKEIQIIKEVKEVFLQFLIRVIPIFIITIVFCFINWTPISSFGMVMFWGIFLITIYHFIVTNNMFKLTAKGGSKDEAR